MTAYVWSIESADGSSLTPNEQDALTHGLHHDRNGTPAPINQVPWTFGVKLQ